jgi:hypothetical protein
VKRRHVLTLAAAGLAVHLVPALAAKALPAMQVFKNPSCGCCGAWIDHLKAAGFDVRVTSVEDTSAVRQKLGLADRFGSCHTALVAGYVVEGHVPADDVKRLLASRPQALGLAVPGMPAGSPGMEVGARQDRYDVLLIDKQGRETVFASHGKA